MGPVPPCLWFPDGEVHGFSLPPAHTILCLLVFSPKQWVQSITEAQINIFIFITFSDVCYSFRKKYNPGNKPASLKPREIPGPGLGLITLLWSQVPLYLSWLGTVLLKHFSFP